MTNVLTPKKQRADAYRNSSLDKGATPNLDFNSVYNRYSTYVAAVALRLSGDSACVDDIVQEVFLDCYKSIDTLGDMSHARRWLVKVTVRKARYRLKKRKLFGFFVSSPSRIDDIPMPGLSEDDRIAMVQLFSLLEEVPVNHRLAWSLRYLEGAGLLETAEACGCSLATVKRWVKSVQRKIAGELND